MGWGEAPLVHSGIDNKSKSNNNGNGNTKNQSTGEQYKRYE